jgi:hypothetical protein
VVFWRFHALYLSADKSYRSPALSVVSNYDSSTPASELNCKHCGGVVNGYVSVTYSAWNTKDNYAMSASVFVGQVNGFMSLTS